MRYIIGIDLGTTNCVVSYVDIETINKQVEIFRIPQIADIGRVEAMATLPSFCYLVNEFEFPQGSLDLPWENTRGLLVGYFAKKYGGRVPTRLVQSAKSWLCHSAANRQDPILPLHNAGDKQISPVQATTAYLKSIKDAWNHKMGKGRHELEFESQEIILTVPASFDEVARGLTVEAAKSAGYTNMALLEEPQAAFYSYISKETDLLEKKLKTGELVLVVDVGGGTTDFSLIEVKTKDDKKFFERMAVGDHLLLGGDNMDALIAHDLEQKLQNISSLQKLQIAQDARNAKEHLLSDENTSFKFVLQGQGSSIILGSLSVEVSKEDVVNRLMDGFFAPCSYDETKTLKRTSGIKSLGLPFEDEPSIIKQLGFFLHQAGDKKPDYILFNGGTMKPKIFQNAVTHAINSWFPEKESQVLSSHDLNLAVSKGAAYYGKVRRGFGVRILGGAARGYYLGLDTKDNKKALCCLPRGSFEDSSYESEQTFYVTPNKPVSFELYTSHVRLNDVSGEIIEVNSDEMQLLPLIHTVLRFGKNQLNDEKIPVHLKVTMTAIGTLDISLLSQISDHKWALEFQLKNASSQDNALNAFQKTRADETYDGQYLDPAKKAIEDAFSNEAAIKLENLMEHLETLLGKSKKDFPPSVLRSLFDTLLLHAGKRFLTKEHEIRFLNLAGFFLRPGFQYPLDDFRIKNFWKIILEDLKSQKSIESQIQRLICYRRIAGGFSKGQQMQLLNEVIPELKNGKIEIKKGENYLYIEKLRAFAAFELIDVTTKVKIGQAVLERLQKAVASDADYFALGRLGARHLIYGTFSSLISVKTVVLWIEKLLEIKNIPEEKLKLILSLLARKTDLAEFNIPQELVNKILTRFDASLHFEMLKQRLTTLSHLTDVEQAQVFGESLPIGLSIE